MNKNISKNLFGMVGGLTIFAMLFSPSASVVSYVMAEEIVPPVVVEEPVVEETTEGDSFVCDVNTNPVISNAKGFYLEYTYGVDANLLTILSDLQLSATDPNDNLVSFFQESITDLAGGVSTLNVGTYHLQYLAVDSDGCTDQEQVTIVVNPSEDLMCDETNRPTVTTDKDLYHFGTSTGTYPYLAMTSQIHSVSYDDPNGTEGVNFSNDLEDVFNFSGISGVPIGVYHVTYKAIDPIGCKGEKLITIVIGPLCQAIAPEITVENSTVEVQVGASYEDIISRAGLHVNDLTDDIEGVPSISSNFDSSMTSLTGTFTLTITAGEHSEWNEQELCIPSTIDITVNVVSGSSGPTGHGGGPNKNTSTVGEVLGATTCDAYFTKYMRKGYANDTEEVKKLQNFLNKQLGLSIPNTGFFGSMTDSGVRQFQSKYANEILSPWGTTNTTGIFYKTTMWKANMIMCETLNTPVPTDLVPFSQYIKSL